MEKTIGYVSPGPSLRRFLATASGRRVQKELFGELGRLNVFGAGKASARFAESFTGLFNNVESCEMNGPESYSCGRVRVQKCPHPLPDAETVKNTAAIVESAEQSDEDAAVVFLLSGGASSMFALPHELTSLYEKREISRLLMNRGASISELNCVRRHISAVKGGRFAAKLYPRRMHTFLISDVPTGIIEDAGSGPTLPDRTTCTDALRVLRKYRLLMKLERRTRAGLENRRLESMKQGDVEVSHSTVHAVASNADATARFASLSRKYGMHAEVRENALAGDPQKAAKRLIAEGRKVIGGRGILVAGGETTLGVPEGARGGRCQHFALAGSPHLRKDEFLIAFGTDGVDGNSGFAGAVGFPSDNESAKYLRSRESEEYFENTGTGIVTGRTDTNVCDIYVYCRL